MRNLIGALLGSFGPLSNVLTVLMFFFAILGILSIQLWGWNGALHGRCRLTEHPIRLPDSMVDAHINHSYLHGQHLLNETIPCLQPNDDTVVLRSNATLQNCAWPVDTAQENLCPLYDFWGMGKCTRGTYCGSNYDRKGQARFADSLVMGSARHSEALSYGYTVFDTMPQAIMTIFHCLTLEGWRFTMFDIQDGYGELGGALFTALLLVFGNFLLL
jgi:hypothetical protein